MGVITALPYTVIFVLVMAFSCASSPCDPLPPSVRSLCFHVQLGLEIFQYRGETHKGIWASHTERKKSFLKPVFLHTPTNSLLRS